MPQITYDVFDGGLDVRKSRDSSGANQLPVLTNAYETKGKEIKKRPCLVKIAELEAGTVGLRSGLGKLNTFYGLGSIVHGDMRFQANFCPHPTNALADVIKVHALEVFEGYLYAAVEYDDGTIKHYYFDDPGAWAAATAYTVGTFRRPTTVNGYRYEVTAIAGTGTSAGVEPVWPTTVGATIVDNAGANQITWTCRAFSIIDTNCPNTSVIMTSSDHIFCLSNTVMRFCKTADARNWTFSAGAPTSDAGFKPVGTQQTGLSRATALAPFQGKIAVFFADGAQIWTSDPNPDNINIDQRIYNIGTRYPKSPISVGTDTFFLSDQGIRSITVSTQLLNTQDSDVGSPIDDLLTPGLVAGIDPFSIFYPGLGQWWWIIGETLWVYAFSRSSRVAAWSKYTFPVTIDSAAQLDGELCVRSANSVYRVDKMATNDDGVIPLVEIELPYQDGKAPGILKLIQGCDALLDGTWSMSLRYDPNDVSKVTSEWPMVKNTTPGSLQPVEMCAVEVAPRLTHQADEAATLKKLIFYYQNLGPE